MSCFPKMQSIGLIGAGKMAQAIVNGILATGKDMKPNSLNNGSLKILASCPEEKILRKLPPSCSTTTNNVETVEKSDLIIIAVKQNLVAHVLREVCHRIDPKRHIVMSIAAGVSLKTCERELPQGTSIVRAMPNVACLVLEGATLYCTKNSSKELDLITRAVFAPISPICQRVQDEKLMDAATALSGSGPAYILYVIEALADAGVREGFSREVALQLATQTVLGAATLSRDSGRHPSVLKDEVISPGGTTAEGLFMLEKYAVKSAIQEAVHIARKKSEALGLLLQK